MTSECWQHLCKYIWHKQINNCKLVFLRSAHICAIVKFRRQHSVSSVFFFFYLVWWHLTLILETPRYRPYHITPTALLSGSCVSYWVRAHAWSRTSLKISLAFLPKCVYHFGTNRMQKKPYRPIRDKQHCSDLGRARNKREINFIAGFAEHFRFTIVKYHKPHRA